MKAKIKTKISLLVLSSLLILGLAMGALSIYELFSLGDKNITSFDRKLREDFDRMSKYQVELALSIVKDFHSQQNDLGVDASKKKARDLIDNMSYGDDGYIFIYDSKGISIATPDEVEGEKLWDLQDPEGRYFIQEIIQSALDNSNYTSYLINRPGESEAAPKRSYSVYFQPWDWIIGTGNYIDDIDEIISNERNNTLQIINRIIRIVVALDIMIIFLASIVALIMGKRFAKPIEVLSLEVESIASGDADLTASVDIASSDEIGILSDSFNLFIRKLRHQVNEIKTAMVKTEQIKDDMASSTVETSAAVEEIQANLDSITQQFGNLNHKISSNNAVTEQISANIETVDAQILDQAEMVEESTAAITEMIASIKNVAHITSNKKEATKALDSMANESRVRIEDTQKAFSTVNSMMTSIHEMANSINDIASQTNLLSMNAAIEAAHAGDSGKGFAVVAEEIRKLAESASDSSNRITNLVNSVTEAVGTTGSNVQATSEAMENVFIEVRDTVGAFNEIESSISELNTGGKQILDATEKINVVTATIREGSNEIKDGTVRMVENYGAIRRISESVNSGVQEISSGSKEIVDAMQQIVSLSQELASVVDIINTHFGRFKS